jgi:hypothetical protein
MQQRWKLSFREKQYASCRLSFLIDLISCTTQLLAPATKYRRYTRNSPFYFFYIYVVRKPAFLMCIYLSKLVNILHQLSGLYNFLSCTTIGDYSLPWSTSTSETISLLTMPVNLIIKSAPLIAGLKCLISKCTYSSLLLLSHFYSKTSESPFHFSAECKCTHYAMNCTDSNGSSPLHFITVRFGLL